jgi:colicin import membrane protein
VNDKIPAIVFSVAVHLVALGLIALSFSQKPSPLGVAPNRAETIEAVAVDDARVEAELRKLRGQEQSARDAEEARQKKAQQELDQARKAKQEEDKRLADLKKQREQEQRETEQQRKQLAELKAQQAEVEKKRQVEQQRLADAQKKREAEEAKAKAAEAQRQLNAKLAAEEKRLAADKKRLQSSRYANMYVAAIQNKVRSNWLRPAGSPGKFECTVAVKQTTAGEVVSAQVTRSCGNAALDRSVEAAVRKASPLPEPVDPTVFDTDLEFNFSPGEQ